MIRHFLMTLLSCSIIVASSNLNLAEEKALSVDQLRDFVKTTLQSKHDEIEQTEIGVQDNTLVIQLGGLARESGGLRAPLEYPLDAMISLELIRRDVVPQFNGIEWDKIFSAADEVIADELAQISRANVTVNELRKGLTDSDKKVRKIFEEAIKKGAIGKKVSIVVPKGAALFDVTVKLDPGEGIAFYLTKLQYDLLHKFGGLDNDRNWNEVATPKVKLGGSFVFRGRWSHDRVRTTAVISINDDQDVLIQYLK